jgi:hypothetical protein
VVRKLFLFGKNRLSKACYYLQGGQGNSLQQGAPFAGPGRQRTIKNKVQPS